MTVTATTQEERPIFFRAAGEELFGIITEPTAKANGIGLILLSGGGVPATSRNRLAVRIARRAAALGYHTLRFDYHGVGESTGVSGAYRLDRPFVEDVLGAVRCLEEQGIGEVILSGECFGARTALASAPRIPRLRGLALFAIPTRDFEMGSERVQETSMSTYVQRAFRLRTVRELFSASRRRDFARIARAKLNGMAESAGTRGGPAERVSPHFAEPFAEVGTRGVPVLLGYGADDEFYHRFREVRSQLADTLDAPGSKIDERVLSGEIHGLSRLDVQDEIADVMESWLASLAGSGAGTP